MNRITKFLKPKKKERKTLQSKCLMVVFILLMNAANSMMTSIIQLCWDFNYLGAQKAPEVAPY